MDWGLAKVLDRGGVADEERSQRSQADDASAIRTAAHRLRRPTSRGPARCWARPAYMAPEQARGELDTLDERADVFGLGSILCEILTGQPAYTGPSGDEVYRKAARARPGRGPGPARRLRRRGRAGRAGQVVPGRRRRGTGRGTRAWSLAGLTAYLAGVQERLRAAELARARAEARAAEERKRRLLVAGLAASVLALAALGAGGGLWLTHQRGGPGGGGTPGRRPRPCTRRRCCSAGPGGTRGRADAAGSRPPRRRGGPRRCSPGPRSGPTCAARSGTSSRRSTASATEAEARLEGPPHASSGSPRSTPTSPCTWTSGGPTASMRRPSGTTGSTWTVSPGRRRRRASPRPRSRPRWWTRLDQWAFVRRVAIPGRLEATPPVRRRQGGRPRPLAVPAARRAGPGTPRTGSGPAPPSGSWPPRRPRGSCTGRASRGWPTHWVISGSGRWGRPAAVRPAGPPGGLLDQPRPRPLADGSRAGPRRPFASAPPPWPSAPGASWPWWLSARRSRGREDGRGRRVPPAPRASARSGPPGTESWQPRGSTDRGAP